ncbi:MAG TPA: ATP-dependent helicase C-terminal domain-containing protein, partial [Rectinemataceae bacterium]|nr:ATP-dependent helicase C-terminal domain-containing protein [Rectinemataceae bacterium]
SSRAAKPAAAPGRAGGPAPAGLGSLLALAFPDRVAKRGEAKEDRPRPGSARFRLPSGRTLGAEGSLAAWPWIVALDADAGMAEGRVYAGAGLTEADALAALAPLITEELRIEWRGLGYRARRVRAALSIVLSETALGALPREEVARAFLERLRAEGLAILPLEGEAGAFLARLRWWRANSRSLGGAGLPDLTEEALAANAAEWLAPFIDPNPEAVLDARGLRRALETLLGHGLRSRFEAEAPETIELPSRARRRLEYAPDRDPAVEARIQELYGLSVHPRILGRPVVFRLLSPAGRPVQVTADLPGFWRGAWTEVRKELRGRYPKHAWPEDPLHAAPATGAPRRR